MQCFSFSRRQFPAQGSAPMGAAPAWTQPGPWKENISWHEVYQQQWHGCWCCWDRKKSSLCQKAGGEFWGEKPSRAGPFLLTQPPAPRTNPASQGINLNSSDKVVLLVLYDSLSIDRSHPIQYIFFPKDLSLLQKEFCPFLLLSKHHSVMPVKTAMKPVEGKNFTSF